TVHFVGLTASLTAAYFVGNGASWSSEPLPVAPDAAASLARSPTGEIRVAGLNYMVQPLPVIFHINVLTRTTSGTWSALSLPYSPRADVSAPGGTPAWLPRVDSI